MKARETVALGRELLGGNGILSDFLVAKVSFSSLSWLLMLVMYRIETYLIRHIPSKD